MKRSITIIGGGLSGLALGCFLRKYEIPVTIIEQGDYPRHKVCGEFICGVSHETLAALGIDALFQDAEKIETLEWFMHEDKVLDKTLPLHGMGISRFLLDDRLQRQFQETGGIIKQERIQKSTFLETHREDIVWAFGKEKRGKGKDKTRWLGMKMHVSGLDIQGLEMHTGGRANNGGYIGLAPIEHDKVNVCGLFEVNKSVQGKGEENFCAYLRSMQLDRLADRIEQASIDPASFSAVAGFSMGHQRVFSAEKQNIFAIGDAALLIPPFTGNGMSIALESALLAGECLLPYCQGHGEHHWVEVLEDYQTQLKKKFRKRLMMAKCMHPFFFHHTGKWILANMAKHKLIPFQTLFHTLR